MIMSQCPVCGNTIHVSSIVIPKIICERCRFGSKEYILSGDINDKDFFIKYNRLIRERLWDLEVEKMIEGVLDD